MIYKDSLASFNLYSRWSCQGRDINGVWRWFIAEGPTEDRKTVDFSISLPADAVISRAWVSAEYGSPLSGAKYKLVNGINIPSSGEVDIEGLTAEMTTFSAVFSFKANGSIFEDTNTHTGSLVVGIPTLNIEYSSESQEAPPPTENDPGNIARPELNGVQLPRLLDNSFLEIARIEPSKVSLDLNLQPLSTAVVEIPAGQNTIKVRDFVELFSPEGSVGIFRVSEVETSYGSYQRVYLEHAYTTLADDLTVGVQGMTGTFGNVISTLLEAQTTRYWALGDVEIPDEYEVVYTYGYETILHAVQNIVGMMPEGYLLELDTLHRPWKMNIRAFDDSDYCECRLSRNLSKVTVNIDTSDLCTRIYPFGAGEKTDRINLSTMTGSLFMDADTKSTWGIVSKTFTNEDIFDAITLKEVAERYLERHKDPTVSVNLDAMALYTLTGETLDRFKTGRLCRMPLNDYDVIMNERVVAISYPDVYCQPQKAIVTLANKVKNMSDEVADLMREASSSKLIGGTVETTEIKSNAGEITSTSPIVEHFNIESYGNLLAARVAYRCSPSASCNVRVDGTSITGTESQGGTVDIFPYLARDESGVPTVGDHYVSLSPIASSSIEHWVYLTITLKTIEKK